MSFETGKAAIDFLLKQNKKAKWLGVTFFGGEPLLEFKLIKKLVRYIKNHERLFHKKIKIGVVTNGTLFTPEIINFFKRNKIGVLFSFDGDKKRMIKVKGEKAYKRCLWAIEELVKNGFKVTARVTVGPDDLRLVDFTRHIFNLGFSDVIFMEVAEKKWGQTRTDKTFMELADYFITQARKGKILEIHDLIEFLAIQHKVIKPKSLPCGPGRDVVAVTVEGKILPCHYLEAWKKDFVLGNVFEGKIDKEKRTPFLNFTREDFIGCKNCLARPYCPGCCLASSYRYVGNMFQPLKGHCIWVKAQVKATEHIYDTLIKKEKNKHLLNLLEEFKKYY